MSLQVLLSKKTDDWATPKFIYDQAVSIGMFDPCPFHSTFDGLQIEWGETNFVNPPYSQLKLWVKKAIQEHEKGRKVLLLIPARTDTKAFSLLFKYGSRINFISGRLRFNEANYAPFPSMLVELIGGGIEQTKCYLLDREDIKL